MATYGEILKNNIIQKYGTFDSPQAQAAYNNVVNAQGAGWANTVSGSAPKSPTNAPQSTNSTPQATTPPGTTINSYLANSVQNPTLPVGTEFVPQTMKVQEGELVTYNPITAGTMGTPNTVAVAPMTTAVGSSSNILVDPMTGQAYLNPAAGQYTATTTADLGGAATMTAAQGVVSPLATMVGQLTKLYSETEEGAIPEWAQGAVRVANDAMAARGLRDSSIGVGAITEAIQQSALEIAARDSSTYFQMDLQNLANEQQAFLVNTQNRQQALLSDQSAINAAKQFNAASGQQISMFQAQLISDIKNQNANRIAAMEQFNAAQANQMELAGTQLEANLGMFNEQQRIAVEQFNVSTQFQKEQFNAQMQAQIDQANARWRQTINTANTAGINAANQLNVQNAFNLSTYSLNALWQSLRDEAQWAFTSAQTAADQNFRLALAANNFDYAAMLNTQQANFAAEAAEGTGWGQILGSILTLWDK